MIPGMGLLYMEQGQRSRRAVQEEGSRGRCMGTGEGQVRKDLRQMQLSDLQYTLSFMWSKTHVDFCAVT